MKLQAGGCLSLFIWKNEVSIMHLVSAIFWISLNSFAMVKEQFSIRVIFSIHILEAIIQSIPALQNKSQGILHWIMVIFLVICDIFTFQIIQSISDDGALIDANCKVVLYAWQVQSWIQLFVAQKLKHKLLIETQRVIDIPLLFVIVLVLGQQILVGVRYDYTMLICIAPILQVCVMHYQICNKYELIILKKEFCQQYINRSQRNTCVFFNYQSNKVQTQKQKILLNLNDITQSTNEKQDECASSNTSNQQKRACGYIVQKSDIEVNIHLNKDNGETASRQKNKSQSNYGEISTTELKFKEEDLKMMQLEFKQARHHFEIQNQHQRSVFNLIKTYFIEGRHIINRQLYKKYKEISINNGLHNLSGSLHIVKYDDNQDYGMISFQQQEFKVLDIFMQRLEQIQYLILSAIKDISLLMAINSISLDKSEVGNQTRTHFANADINGDNVTNSNMMQPTKQQLESPGTMIYSNTDINTQFQKRLTVYPPMTYQSQSNFNFIKGSQMQNSNINENPKSLNKINLVNVHSFSNINILNDITQCYSNNIQLPIGANTLQNKYLQNKNSLNTKNNPPTSQGNQQQQEACFQNSSCQHQSIYLSLIKARIFIHTMINDVREYQLSCRELSNPEYNKYKTKWLPAESKGREEYENEQQSKTNIEHQPNYQQFFKDIYQLQKWLYKSNNGLINLNYFEGYFVDLILNNDVQSYSLNKRKSGIYPSIVNRIEDMYQQRTAMINLKLVLESFVRILSVGEKTALNLEQFTFVDIDVLSEEEKQKLREVYGDQIIDENSGKILGPYMKTQVTGIYQQIQNGNSNQTSPILSRTDRSNICYQEEDLETFKDMVLSIIQQLFSLYKDHSNSISMSVHKFYSKEGQYNPSLKFRKLYLKETLKANLQILSQIQNQKQNQTNNLTIANPIHYQNNSNIFPLQNQNSLNKNTLIQKGMQQLPQKRHSISSDKKTNNNNVNNDQQISSISNIQHVSSKISPYKQLKASLQYAAPSSSEQSNQEVQQNKLLQQNQLSENTTENNQSFNQNVNNNNNSQANYNQPSSATKKMSNLNNITEQVSYTMSNSNYQNAVMGQDKNIPAVPSQYYYNNIPNVMAQLETKMRPIIQPISMNDLNQQQSLIQSTTLQHQILEVKSNINPMMQNDQSININNMGSPRDYQDMDTLNIEEMADKGKYRKLRVARINIEINQTVCNDVQTSQYSKNAHYLSQIEEFIQYLSPIPLIYKRTNKDQFVVHSYSFYVENFVYMNNEFNYSEVYHDKIRSFQSHNANQGGDDLSDDDDDEEIENIEIVSLDQQQTKQKDKKFNNQNLNRISEQNIKEERFNSESSQYKNQRPSMNKESQNSKKLSSAKFPQQSSRAFLNIEGVPLPHTSNMNSNLGSFQRSQDNFDSDRKFIKTIPQTRDQQISFNGKLDGTQSPFNQEYTQVELNLKENNTKHYSNINLNNYTGINDLSNIGYTDRLNVEEPSAERKLSENIAKFTKTEDTTNARPHHSRSIGGNSRQQTIKKDQDTTPSNKSLTDEYDYSRKESVGGRDKDISFDESQANKVRGSNNLKSMPQKNTASTMKGMAYRSTQARQNRYSKGNSGSQNSISKIPDNQSEGSEFEYRKDLIDERDERELTIILERSEQNNSIFNTHYKNQLSKQISSKINENHLSIQGHSILNYKSQFQSQFLPDDHKQNISNFNSKNIVLNSQGTRDLYGFESQQYEGKSLIHNNVQISTYQHQLNSFISGGGNTQNQYSQNFENKALNKEDQATKDLIISSKMN